jgi:hypothetical protein
MFHTDKQSIMPKSNESNESSSVQLGAEHVIPKFETGKFSYSDLKKITNDFKNNIGAGGYGSVYLGHLENGLPVAVKKLSQSSTQGVREFLAEVITTHPLPSNCCNMYYI